MDDFSDDSLDDLNETVLQELENNAIQFTQARQSPSQAAQPQPRFQNAPTQHSAVEYDFDDDDLDDTIVIDEHAQPQRPPPHAQQPLPPQPRHAAAGGTQRWNHHLPPSRPSYPTRPQFPQPSRTIPQPVPLQRYPAPSQRYPPPSGPQQAPPSQFARPPLPIPRPYPQPSQAPHAGPANQNDVISNLQARLSELQSDLTAAKGEASILRSKYEKARATHDAEVARLKKETADQLAKQERLAEQARAAERTTATELQFARQDLREELGRVKFRRKDGPATPRKDTRTWGIADGFDGVEILSSPTKGQSLKRKDSTPALPGLPPAERTPSKGKRKRPIVDSPTFALETDGGDAVFDQPHATTPSLFSPLVFRPQPLDYLRLFLDHTAIHGQPPTFDDFSHYAFPSDPQHSLASMLLQKLPQMGRPGDPVSLLVDFADTIIEMWHRCLSERYYGPIYHLVALVLYTLDFNAVDVAPHIIAPLIPVCATTCRLVALPQLNTVDGNLAEHPDAVIRQLCLNINVTQCLSLLSLAALACLPQSFEERGPDSAVPSPQLEFWRTMEFDFVLMMLSPKHPEADWLAMMSLIRTSVAPDSIGPIPSSATGAGVVEAQTPAAVAATLIDCVSSFLCAMHPPRWAADPGSVKEIVARNAALDTLATFATSPFGALQIAESDVAIPRLVTMLCWAIDRLYDSDLPVKVERKTDPGGSQTEAGDDMDLDRGGGVHKNEMNGPNPAAKGMLDLEFDPTPDPMTLLYHIISRATWFLHYLVTDQRTAGVANVSAKLAASHGGSQRYCLTLARLTFAEEDLVLEAGIDAETVELAHELLELAVTPDEGEEISEMFD
ncbi:hypothetical protein N658DRAFT_459540 [Parathielavia hyrcaniae]|uniref:DNA repair protein Rad26 n=1 Tax=Parathielavia hyrcaniae TaxID=113614 RepID=A0AAN6PV48_9PEZI|nr:hypothetical protein N658DRAFT_459540 [Parathielavia hyrcaniae]